MIRPPIIGRRCRYVGTAHVWARKPGVVVVVGSVFRGDAILRDDAQIGELRPGDRIEFNPIIREVDGTERLSWVGSDATPDDLEAL